jgi:L-amino acid N-acyltransferase YncA
VKMVYPIREMRETDWDQVKEIYQQGMDTNLATFQTECPSYEEFDQSHLEDCRFVAVDGDTIVGWTALTAVSNRCVYRGVAEVSIYVRVSYKGKQIGTQLLNHLIAKSEERGIWTLQSGIMEDNPASIHLHEKCGFRMVGLRERIGKDRYGVWRNTVLMERRSNLF